MSNMLPENTNVSRSKQVPRSLLSAPQDEKEQNQWLPLAPMIRHWFDKWITEGKQLNREILYETVNNDDDDRRRPTT